MLGTPIRQLTIAIAAAVSVLVCTCGCSDQRTSGSVALTHWLLMAGVPDGIAASTDRPSADATWLAGIQKQLQAAQLDAFLQPLTAATDSLLDLSFPALTFFTDGRPCVLMGWNALEETVCLIDNRGTVTWQPWRIVVPQLHTEALVLNRQPDTDRPAELVVVGGRIDLGTLTGDGTERKQVTVFNRGDRPLRIKDQRFSCGCTVGTLEATYIQPHGCARMDLEVDVSKFNRPNLGLKWLAITDGPQARVEVPVEGIIRRPVRFSPDFFNLGIVSPGNARRELQMEVVDLPEGVRPADVDVRPLELSAGLKWVGVRRHSSGLTVRMAVEPWETDRDETGFFRVEGTLAVSGKTQRLYVIGASGRLEPWITAWPSIVNVGRVSPGTSVERVVRLHSSATGKYAVSVLQPEYVQARVQSGELRLTFTAPDQPPVFRTAVLVHVGEQSLKIPIVGELEETNAVAAGDRLSEAELARGP